MLPFIHNTGVRLHLQKLYILDRAGSNISTTISQCVNYMSSTVDLCHLPSNACLAMVTLPVGNTQCFAQTSLIQQNTFLFRLHQIIQFWKLALLSIIAKIDNEINVSLFFLSTQITTSAVLCLLHFPLFLFLHPSLVGVEGGVVKEEAGPSKASSEPPRTEQEPKSTSEWSIEDRKGKKAASIRADADEVSVISSTTSDGTYIPRFRNKGGGYTQGECSGDAQGWERDRSDTDEITSVTDTDFPSLGAAGQWKPQQTRRHGEWLDNVKPFHAPPSVDSRSQAGESVDTGYAPISDAAGLALRAAAGSVSSGSEPEWQDDGSEYDDDSDEDGVPSGVKGKSLTFNHSKEVLQFLDDITTEQPARLTSKTEEWKCKVCFGGPGSGDWYPGLQSLVAHAKTVQSRRPTAHREFLTELKRRLESRDIVIPNLTTPKVTGLWSAPSESHVQDMEKTIMWPPIVMVVNTRLGKENDMVGFHPPPLPLCLSFMLLKKRSVCI